MNTLDLLSIANSICPDREMIVYRDSRWSYAQANERINRLTHALIRLGVQKGDRVGMLQVNCNQYIEAYFAAAKTGAIFVPLNFRAKADELNYMIADSEAKILFVGNRYYELIESMLPELSSVEECIFIDDEKNGRLDYEELISSS